MPYVQKLTRERFELTVDPTGIDSCGDLNYLFTKLCIKYMEEHGLSYQTCNDIVGALDNAKDEFRRRVQHDYENSKIEVNGDVYKKENN